MLQPSVISGLADLSSVPSTTEHARAIIFFVMLTHHMPEFRDYLLAPTGVPLLIQNISGLDTANPPIPMFDLCGGLAGISWYSWCLSPVALDVCQTLINLLVYVLVTTLFSYHYLTFFSQHQPEQQQSG
jgi:hypothetical protein